MAESSEKVDATVTEGAAILGIADGVCFMQLQKNLR